MSTINNTTTQSDSQQLNRFLSLAGRRGVMTLDCSSRDGDAEPADACAPGGYPRQGHFCQRGWKLEAKMVVGKVQMANKMALMGWKKLRKPDGHPGNAWLVTKGGLVNVCEETFKTIYVKAYLRGVHDIEREIPEIINHVDRIMRMKIKKARC